MNTFIHNVKRIAGSGDTFLLTTSDGHYGPNVSILTRDELLQFARDIQAVATHEIDEARSKNS